MTIACKVGYTLFILFATGLLLSLPIKATPVDSSPSGRQTFITTDTSAGGQFRITITASDTAKSYSRLATFGLHPLATYCIDPSLGEIELPPTPPAGVLDIRFIDRQHGCLGLGVQLDLHPFLDTSQVDTFEFVLQPGMPGSPLRLEWPDVRRLYKGPVQLMDVYGGAIVNIDMKAQESVILPKSRINDFLIIAATPVYSRTNYPVAVTGSATDIGPFSAVLHGTVLTGGLPTKAIFQWGTNESYGYSSGPMRVSDSLADVSYQVQGLQASTIYHYRLIAQRDSFTSVSFDHQFRTTSTDTAGLFSEIRTSIPGFAFTSLAWGDYNNDGYPDLLIIGFSEGVAKTKIFRNNGNSTFTDIHAPLNGVASPNSAAWIDYDNDGYLDILVSGETDTGAQFTPRTFLYHNNHDGTFTPVNAGFVDALGSFTWGDYDNDGDMDLLINGRLADGSYATKLYRNDGNGQFTDMHVPFPGVWASCVKFADYNNDGRLDILLTGYGDVGMTTILYRNDGNSIFTPVTTPFLHSNHTSIGWADYDNDGDLDVLIAGNNGEFQQPKTILYRNDNGAFTPVTTSLPFVATGSVAWADFDGDGWPDVAITGTTGYNSETKTYSAPMTTKIFRNNHDGTFSDAGISMPGLYFGSLAWCDIDGDGDPDLIISGWTSVNPPSGPTTKIYRNNRGMNSRTLDPLYPPELLTDTVQGNTVSLSWDYMFRGIPTQGTNRFWTYNVRVGTTPGGSDIVSPGSNTSTGFLQYPSFGFTGSKKHWEVKNLASGTYYWAVQAVSGSFQGSQFSAEGQFTINVRTPTPAPQITQVKDVPNDQGKQVSITFLASSKQGDPATPVTQYSIWRQDDSTWTPVGAFPARADQYYSFVAPTLFDSTIVNGQHLTTFEVTAHTASPLLFFTSTPTSGYSMDNLSPHAPENFQVSQQGKGQPALLTWTAPPENDVQYYNIYRSIVPGFAVAQQTWLTKVIGTQYTDGGAGNGLVYYKITAVDYSGNESPAAIAHDPLGVQNGGNQPDVFRLQQNYPNPFNPTTHISFDLPEASFVTLKVYNILGEEVSALAEGNYEAGTHEANWNAASMPSGVYQYRLSAIPRKNGDRAFVQTMRMVLTK